MSKFSYLLLSFLMPMSATAQQVALKMNEIQIVGTHNSYHAGISPNEMTYLRQTNPRAANSLDYRHPALTVQLDAGVRQLELDVYGDSKGGLFANPAGPGLAAKAGLPADPPFDPEGVMKKPGFKVLHVQDIDYRSNCQPFVACLAIIRAWSKAHPGHLPIFVLVENKDGRPRAEYMTTPEPLTAETFDALDAEIRSVFPPPEIVTLLLKDAAGAVLETSTSKTSMSSSFLVRTELFVHVIVSPLMPHVYPGGINLITGCVSPVGKVSVTVTVDPLVAAAEVMMLIT